MAARDSKMARAIAEAVAVFGVPLFGMAGTAHESAAAEVGVAFEGEFFADLQYDDEGGLIIPRVHSPVDLDRAAARLSRALQDGYVKSNNDKPLTIRFGTVCIHSDPPNAHDVAARMREVLDNQT